MCSSEKKYSVGHRCAGVTLGEAIAAVVVLGLITTAVLVVMNRCITAANQGRAKMQASEAARKNMEKLLASPNAGDKAETGTGRKNDGMDRLTAVDSFREPVTGRTRNESADAAGLADSNSTKQAEEPNNLQTDAVKEEENQPPEQQQRQEEYIRKFDLYTQNMEPTHQAVRVFLQQTGLNVTAYNNFLDQQKQQSEDSIRRSDFDDRMLDRLMDEQVQAELDYLTSIGFDEERFNEFLDTYNPAAYPTGSGG